MWNGFCVLGSLFHKCVLPEGLAKEPPANVEFRNMFGFDRLFNGSNHFSHANSMHTNITDEFKCVRDLFLIVFIEIEWKTASEPGTGIWFRSSARNLASTNPNNWNLCTNSGEIMEFMLQRSFRAKA